MKIAFLVPGSGDAFYCENCRRDLPLVRELRSLDIDVTLLPLYMPLTFDADGVRMERVYCGALSLFLRSRIPFLKDHVPSVSRLLDARPLLNLLPSLSGLTRTRGLEEMTLSMIRGTELFQTAEFEELVSFLKTDRPDWIHLSNFLLAGVGVELKRRLPVKLSCTLQDEDTWIDAMREPYRSEALTLMRHRAECVDRFLPVSAYYAGFMGEYLHAEHGRMAVVPPALSLGEPAELSEQWGIGNGGMTIGFLSRASAENGLDLLAEAFLRLKPRHPGLKLLVAGGSTSDDGRFLSSIRRRLGLHSRDVRFLPNPDRAERRDFFRSVSVLSVPVRNGSAFGTFIAEALAEGVPVVQPAAGAYPEILSATGGGLLFEPGSAASLANRLDLLLSDPALAGRLGREGREGVFARFSPRNAALAFTHALSEASLPNSTDRSVEPGASPQKDGEGPFTLKRPTPGSIVLSLRGVTKAFRNPDGSLCAEVLREISLEVSEGETVAVMGPSGSGKTTLLRICGLLEKPDSGELRFRGKDVVSLGEAASDGYRNRCVGFVFQEHGLLHSLTVLENVLLPTLADGTPPVGARRIYRKRAEALLECVGLENYANRFPPSLSSGERQRAALVRAAIMEPSLILADEPTAALDRKNAATSAMLLDRIARLTGASVLLVTHDRAVSSLMRRTLYLSDGLLSGDEPV